MCRESSQIAREYLGFHGDRPFRTIVPETTPEIPGTTLTRPRVSSPPPPPGSKITGPLQVMAVT